MKKILISLVLVTAMAISSFAQFEITAGYMNNRNSGVNLLKGTAGILRQEMTDASVSLTNTPLTAGLYQNGAFIGVSYGIKIGGNGFKIAPGIQYQFSTVGLGINLKALSGSENIDGNARLTTHDILVPIKFSYTFKTSGLVKPFVFVDPSFKFGLSAGLSVKASVDGEEYKTKNPFNLYKPDIKASLSDELASLVDDKDASEINGYAKVNMFDFLPGGGFGILVGNHFSVECGYKFGVVNRLNNKQISDYGFGLNTNTVQVGVSYMF